MTYQTRNMWDAAEKPAGAACCVDSIRLYGIDRYEFLLWRSRNYRGIIKLGV
jgi:hypothetical protein